MKIERLKEENTIFIGNIKKNWTESQVNNIFRTRLKNITEIKYLSDPNLSNKNRGYCFLKFENLHHSKQVIILKLELISSLWFEKDFNFFNSKNNKIGIPNSFKGFVYRRPTYYIRLGRRIWFR